MNRLLIKVFDVLQQISCWPILVTLLGIVFISGGLKILKTKKVAFSDIKGVYQGWTKPSTLKEKDAEFVAKTYIIGGLFFLVIGLLMIFGALASY
jgi:hypothetical protein